MTAEKLMALSVVWFLLGFLSGDVGVRVREKVKSAARPKERREWELYRAEDRRRPW